MSYLTKLKGSPAAIPPSPSMKEIIFIAIGAFLAASVIGFLAYYTKQPIIMGSFGASIFVLFVLPDSPFAQPRNVIIGHFITTLIGLIFYNLVSSDWWSMALALAFAIAAMQLLRVPHPPAGSNPFIVFLLGANWDYLWMPTVIGAILIVVVALIYNNISRDRSYPKYW
ncbi:HPP family protein [Candidatus Thioglobus sp. NP1]|uniref:HPP family protein n=1 Tax=Candidatus Thioglobus sp. NP1 TaxID=2508687 RepID=UPI000DEDC7F1|nr:HPP family protein [Candidatus Thioglobus sp. NP1]AXE61794.1 HPP family protein [Candidatus Thioglobus sp. NP1]|tara:strand:+ start:41 stop:547 length:507 start_codon:yes stop_codon:yes gene_type:complete